LGGAPTSDPRGCEDDTGDGLRAHNIPELPRERGDDYQPADARSETAFAPSAVSAS
jgi:hypothetical protein